MSFGQPTYSDAQSALNAARSGKRSVFSSDMIPHLWAHQAQDEARNSKGSLYFRGRTIYSYRDGAPIGVLPVHGASTVFLNSDRYSVTTSGHQSMTRSAVRHFERIVSLPSMDAIASAIAHPDTYPERVAASAISYVRECGADLSSDDLAALAEACHANVAQLAEAQEAGKRDKLENAKARAAAQAAEALRIARQLASMNDDGFAFWRRQFMWAVNERMDASAVMCSIAQAEKQAADVLKRLRKAIKVARDAGDADTVATLKARVAKQKAADAQMRPDAIKAYRIVQARKLRDYRATWRRLKAEGDFARMLAFLESEWLVGQAGSEVAIRAHRRNRAYVEPHAAAILADRQRQREVEAKLKREQEIARKAAALATWLEGGNAIPPRHDAEGGAYMRKRRDYLQTSQGAEVPWSHALRVFALLKLCRERGEGWTRNGRTLRVGHFQVDSVKPDGSFVAGCHSFSWPEIERLAMREGVYDTAPADTREAHA